MKTAISIDIDWAPDEVIEFTCNELKEAGVKATFFATHSSPVINEIMREPDFEVCPHPNYYPLFQKVKTELDFFSITDHILQKFPDSKGIRTHGLITGFPLLQHFKEIGLKYDASMYVHEQFALKPFKIFDNFYRIPHSFEDDVNFAIGHQFNFNPGRFNTDLFIADFHPVHLFLNTCSTDHYESAKVHYKSPDMLKKHKFEGPGTFVFFKELIQHIRLNALGTLKFSELI